MLLFYVFYRAQIYHSGAQFDYYLKYYFITFLFIILSFISFFIPKKLRVNIAIASITILILIYLFEGYLIIKNLNIPIIDLKTELFDKHANPKSLFPLGKLNRPHYNEEGFKLAGKLIYKKIDELER